MYPLGITLDFQEEIVHTINQDGIWGYSQDFNVGEIHYGTNKYIQQAQYVG